MKEGSGPREEKQVLQEGGFYLTFHFDFEVEIWSIQSEFHEKSQHFVNEVDANPGELGSGLAGWWVKPVG